MRNAAVLIAESHEFLAEDLPAAPAMRCATERRLDQRNAVTVRANLTIPGRSVLPGRILDISRGGASMIVPFELAPGQACHIDFELQACGESRAYHIPAEIRYSVELGKHRFRVGFCFGAMDTDTAALLATLTRS